MHKKEGGVLYKIVYFDENFLRGGYYTNTKIITINDKQPFKPINHYPNYELSHNNTNYHYTDTQKRLDTNPIMWYNT